MHKYVDFEHETVVLSKSDSTGKILSPILYTAQATLSQVQFHLN